VRERCPAPRDRRTATPKDKRMTPKGELTASIKTAPYRE
jgi:hypothetical protein